MMARYLQTHVLVSAIGLSV